MTFPSDGLRSIRPKKIVVAPDEAVHSSQIGAGDTQLTVFTVSTGSADPLALIRERKAEIEHRLLQTGGVLFRGLGFKTAADFEALARLFAEDLFADNGEHLRTSVSANVYSPVFYPPEERLLWHNENSFNASGPAKIWFGCVKPADEGGETPVVDSRAVYRRLSKEIREPFEAKGVTYVRSYGTGLGLGWQKVFRTADRKAVEARCRVEGMEFAWSGDVLRTWCVRPAVIDHPLTGDRSWFNQAQHWHTSCIGGTTRDELRSLFDEENMPRRCLYGDGTAIPDEMLAEILQTYEQLELAIPWEPGDVMMLDNMLMAHGRNPYHGERKLLVAMGDMIDYYRPRR